MIPDRIVAGDTLSFLTSVANYPASAGWVLTHVLIPRLALGGDVLVFAATAEGDDHRSIVAAATTADWTAGEYTWRAYVARTTERHTIDGGTLLIVANPVDAVAGYDERSDAAKIVAAIDAMLAGRATLDQEEYEIAVGGSMRRLRYCSRTDLIALRSHYALILQRETAASRIAQGLGNPRKQYVRFR